MANQPWMNISGNYKTLKILGEGNYGQVIKCLQQDTKEIVAVKVLKKRQKQHTDIRELFILEKLKCLDPDKSNIVRLHEWFHRIDRTFMVFEMLDMSLYDYLSRRKWVPLPLNGIRAVIKDVATALNALKGIGLIHTDLKLDNIMLVNHQKQPFRVKLIDFGLCYETSKVWSGLCVQPLWNRSPEIILGLPFTEVIDIWSLGSVMAEMLLGFPLFPGRIEYDVLHFIIDLVGEPPRRLLNSGIKTPLFFYGSRKRFMVMHWTLMTPLEYHTAARIRPTETRKYKFSSLDYLKTLSLHKKNSAEFCERSDCVELLKEMLQIDPKNRITPRKILEHPFITWSHLSPSSQCEIKCPPSVITHQTTQSEEATEQSSCVSNQGVQNKMTSSPNAEDDSDYISETASEISNDSEFNTDYIKTSPSVDSDIMSFPSVAPDNNITLHTLEVSDPKKKKKKKKRGMRGFFSTLKRNLLSCFCVSVKVLS